LLCVYRAVPKPQRRNLLHHRARHLTILAYEMNGAPVSVLHGAPLRLRCENELGFKQVKWIEAIEFVDDFSHLGAGQGGYNEDHKFYGYRMPIYQARQYIQPASSFKEGVFAWLQQDQ